MSEPEVVCPHCLGCGEEYKPGDNLGDDCHLCEGKGSVLRELGESYIKDLLIIEDDREELDDI